ncbi:hypothetical protein ACJJ02_001677 [Streptococcus pyogenes]|nr:hypothetical protein [Streptococcus pyogenes]
MPTPFWDTSIYRTGTVGIEPTHLLLALRKEFSDLANVPKQGATSTVFQSRFMFLTGFARIERA